MNDSETKLSARNNPALLEKFKRVRVAKRAGSFEEELCQDEKILKKF